MILVPQLDVLQNLHHGLKELRHESTTTSGRILSAVEGLDKRVTQVQGTARLPAVAIWSVGFAIVCPTPPSPYGRPDNDNAR